MGKLINNERHIYLNLAMVESEARDLIDTLREAATYFPVEVSRYIPELAYNLETHLNNTNPRHVTTFEMDSELVLKTRDCYCISCEQNERIPGDDWCEECHEKYDV